MFWSKENYKWKVSRRVSKAGCKLNQRMGWSIEFYRHTGNDRNILECKHFLRVMRVHCDIPWRYHDNIVIILQWQPLMHTLSASRNSCSRCMKTVSPRLTNLYLTLQILSRNGPLLCSLCLISFFSAKHSVLWGSSFFF